MAWDHDLEKTPLLDARQRRIEERAYVYWEQRGRPIGSPEVDWLKAEREIDDDAPWNSDGRIAPHLKQASGTEKDQAKEASKPGPVVATAGVASH